MYFILPHEAEELLELFCLKPNVHVATRIELNVICEQRWIQLELQDSPSRVLHLMANYTLPFSKPVKSDHN